MERGWGQVRQDSRLTDTQMQQNRHKDKDTLDLHPLITESFWGRVIFDIVGYVLIFYSPKKILQTGHLKQQQILPQLLGLAVSAKDQQSGFPLGPLLGFQKISLCDLSVGAHSLASQTGLETNFMTLLYNSIVLRF